MGIETFKKLLKRIKYKPTFSIGITDHSLLGAVQVCVRHQVPNACKSGEMTTVQSVELFHYEEIRRIKRGGAIRRIKNMIVGLELHEVDEWLKIDNKHVTDPHPELKKGSTS